MRWVIAFHMLVFTLAGAVAFHAVTPAPAVTNGKATILWVPTVDGTLTYELRWKHFGTGDQWVTVATGLDSRAGHYVHTWTPMENTTGDRTACWDIRAQFGTAPSTWLSDQGLAVCAPIPRMTVVVPNPPPPLAGLQVVSAKPNEVILSATTVDCTRLATSTRGSNALVIKRTIVCVK